MRNDPDGGPIRKHGRIRTPQRSSRIGPLGRARLAPPLALAIVALAAALSACGGGSDTSTATGVETGLATTPAPPPTETAPAPPPTQTQTAPAPPPQTTQTTTTPAPPPQTSTATAPTTPAPPSHETRSCGQIRGGFIMDIRSTGASCATARGIAGSWLDQAAGGPGKVITVGEFRCTASLRGEAASVTCSTGGAETITFHASP